MPFEGIVQTLLGGRVIRIELQRAEIEFVDVTANGRDQMLVVIRGISQSQHDAHVASIVGRVARGLGTYRGMRVPESAAGNGHKRGKRDKEQPAPTRCGGS